MELFQLQQQRTSSAVPTPTQSASCSIFPLSQHVQLWRAKRSTFQFSPLSLSRRSIASSPTKWSKWDSNSEGMSWKGFREGNNDEPKSRRKKRRWWSVEFEEDKADEDGENVGILEEAIDSIWIFKVFRSYGWALPSVLLSLLLATGPKAFLMALSVSIAQSALALALNKLFGENHQSISMVSARRKRKRGTWSQNPKRERMEFQSRTGSDEDETFFPNHEDISEDEVTSSFGGWDELDSRVSGRSKPQEENSKWSKKLSREDAPLLLRLLIAMFPFLGS